MKELKLTEEELQQLRPDANAVDAEAAEVANEQAFEPAKEGPRTALDIQRDLIHMTEMREHALCFLVTFWLPKFKEEKAEQYRLIMREFAKTELDNIKAQKSMWERVLGHYRK